MEIMAAIVILWIAIGVWMVIRTKSRGWGADASFVVMWPVHWWVERGRSNDDVLYAAVIEASMEYKRLLRIPHLSPSRLENQSRMAALRDFIAQYEGREAQMVQDEYEAAIIPLAKQKNADRFPHR